jgi:choice-of-anchor B domain-containing protein
MARSRLTLISVCLLAAASIAVDVADACLLADRLRIIAPHLSEEEIAELAHGNMNRTVIPYAFGGPEPCADGMADIFPCHAVDLLGFLTLDEIGGGSGNDLWGWTDPIDDREYALVGRSNGTAFVDVSDPKNPVYVGNLPSHTSSSSWRDIKVYNDHAFVVSDNNGNHGMQVFDLTQLRSVTTPPVTFGETAHYAGFANAHNVVINEETGFAYAVGSNSCSGGLHMVDISLPSSPQSAGCFSSDGYTHDAQCVIYDGPDTEHVGREICFNSNEDSVTVVDVTDKASPVALSITGYTNSGYTHQGWLTEDHRYFVHDDEFDEFNNGHTTRTYTWDMTDLDSPVVAGFWDAAGFSVDHNQYIKGEHTYQANYKRGLRILQLVDPSVGAMQEVAFFDTYPSVDDNGFSGAWSTYPFFSSGIVLVSDISRGLFILRPQFDIFDDGFESGDLSAWDDNVPLF